MGTFGLESRLISTVANCKMCKPSDSWLGRKSPKDQIKNGKMWVVQHLKGLSLTAEDKEAIVSAIKKTEEFLALHR